jgi:hypothetical protein
MIKKYYVGIIVIILFVVFSIVILVYNKARSRNYPELTIRHSQYFDSSKGIILIGQEGISHGDFQWQSTIYQNDNIGSIYGEFEVSILPFKSVTVSRLKKIQNTGFDSVSRATCSGIKYEKLDSFSRVNDGDILCVSMDKNRDGIYGDGYLKLKIISHSDSKEGKYADSMTFIYNVL